MSPSTFISFIFIIITMELYHHAESTVFDLKQGDRKVMGTDFEFKAIIKCDKKKKQSISHAKHLHNQSKI